MAFIFCVFMLFFCSSIFFFFFQVEDGIRDRTVTGVQTCALPIWRKAHSAKMSASRSKPFAVRLRDFSRSDTKAHMPLQTSEIGVANRTEANRLRRRLPA